MAIAIVGEVQGDPAFAENPGNLMLRHGSDLDGVRALGRAGAGHGAPLSLRRGHAGTMAHPPIDKPTGPSALSPPGLTCAGYAAEDLRALPASFAKTAALV